MDRLRNCCVTWHVTDNHTYETMIEQIKQTKGVSYGILGREVCPTTQRQHLQGYLEFETQKSFKTLTKLFKGIHVEARHGTQEQAIEYCKKEGSFVEFGTKKIQGERIDLKGIADKIKNGETTVSEIILSDPYAYHLYGRTFEAVETLVNEKKFRTWMTGGEWIYGPTGVGKSHYAYYGWDPEKCYEWKLTDKGWQDGYRGQEYVVINDFRGEIPYNDLLKMIDKFVYDVPRRGKSPFPFLAKHVVITSSLPPDEIYVNRMERDSIKQLLRRLTIVQFESIAQCEARMSKHFFTRKCSEGNTNL